MDRHIVRNLCWHSRLLDSTSKTRQAPGGGGSSTWRTQPRMSNLLRGKIELFSLDTLVNMAVAAGLEVELRLGQAA